MKQLFLKGFNELVDKTKVPRLSTAEMNKGDQRMSKQWHARDLGQEYILGKQTCKGNCTKNDEVHLFF